VNRSNVKAVRSNGGECFVCEERLHPGEPSISVSFRVPLLIASVDMEREMHIECAKEMKKLIGDRIKEAK
jgi:hypothetical protein